MLIISIYAIVVTFEKRKFKNKYYSEIDKTEESIDSIKALNFIVKDLTLKQQIWTKNVQNQSEATNNKLIQDEKTIDNSVITDRERDSILASYERQR